PFVITTTRRRARPPAPIASIDSGATAAEAATPRASPRIPAAPKTISRTLQRCTERTPPSSFQPIRRNPATSSSLALNGANLAARASTVSSVSSLSPSTEANTWRSGPTKLAWEAVAKLSPPELELGLYLAGLRAKSKVLTPSGSFEWKTGAPIRYVVTGDFESVNAAT